MKDDRYEVKNRIDKLKSQGIEFYNGSNIIAKRFLSKDCCDNKRYVSVVFIVLLLCVFFYVFSKIMSDNNKVSNGNITIEVSFSHNDGIYAESHIHLLVYGSKKGKEIIIPAKTIMNVSFESDKHVIIRRPIVFHQKVVITDKRRIPYQFSINKTEFIKSTKMRIEIDSLSFYEVIELR